MIKKITEETAQLVESELQQKCNGLVNTACSLFEVNKDSLLNSKKVPNSEVRFAIFKILRDEGNTVMDIGKALNRTHCSVIYGCNQVDYALKYHCNKRLEFIYNTLEKAKDGGNFNMIHTNVQAIQDWLSVSSLPQEYVTTLMENIDMLKTI